MKTLPHDALVELMPATLEQFDKCLAEFELAAPIECRDPGYLRRLAQEGYMHTAIASFDGKPAFFIGWHVTMDGGFWLDLVLTLGAGGDYADGVRHVEQMARERGCRYVRWVTMRKGIAKRWAPANGYHAEAVILTKVL